MTHNCVGDGLPAT